MSDAGYTPEEIRRMYMSDVNRLLSWWSGHPPVRRMVAGYLGYKERPSRAAEPATKTTAQEFIGMFPGGVIRGD